MGKGGGGKEGEKESELESMLCLVERWSRPNCSGMKLVADLGWWVLSGDRCRLWSPAQYQTEFWRQAGSKGDRIQSHEKELVT